MRQIIIYGVRSKRQKINKQAAIEIGSQLSIMATVNKEKPMGLKFSPLKTLFLAAVQV